MKPPVAILVHDADHPIDAVYYPFAEFSPEWQAMRWAISHNVPVRFMDLPQAHRMAVHRDRLKQLLAEDGKPLDRRIKCWFTTIAVSARSDATAGGGGGV